MREHFDTTAPPTGVEPGARLDGNAEQRLRDAEIVLRLADAANRALGLADVYEPALEAVCEALGVDRASILTYDHAQIMRFRAWRGLSEPYRRGVDGHSPWSPDEPAARPIFIADVRSDPSCAYYRALLEKEAIGAVAFVPLVAERRLLGKLMVYAREPRTFTERDERLARAIAAQVSQAVLRAELLASERRARAHAERLAETASRLQTLTAALSKASSVAEVSQAIVAHGASVAGAATAGLWLLERDGEHMALASSHGFSRSAARFARIRLAAPPVPLPVVDSVRTGEPLWFGSRLLLGQHYPDAVGAAAPRPELASAVLPLLVEDRCAGVLAFTFDEPHEFPASEKHGLLVLARHCAQAVGRARLFDLEASARSEAEAAQRRTALLLEANSVLAASLDFEETLPALARIVVPGFADGCAVELALEPGAEPRLLALENEDRRKVALGRELRRRLPRASPLPRALDVLGTGRTVLVPDLAHELTPLLEGDGEGQAILRELAPGSAILVPMQSRDRVYGTISFVFGESGRSFGRADLEVAELIGRRAAVAVENALLHRTAQTAIRAREKVLAVVSHDLRNPLNVVQLAASNLRRAPIPGEPGAALRRKAESIQGAVLRMERLISDLLDFSGMQGDRFTIAPAPCAVPEIVAASVEELSELARERGLELAADIAGSLPLVVCDRGRIIQALGNLLSNAVKVTPAGGRVTVRAAAAGDELVLRVEDTGPGIPSQELPRLFEPYWRGESASYHGTGLGLAIAKGIATAHGGRIAAENRASGGCAFTLAIPLTTLAASAGGPPARSLPETTPEREPAPDARLVLTPPAAPGAESTLVSTADLVPLLAQAPLPVCVFRGPTLVFEAANEQFRRITGRLDPTGRTLLEAFPELEGQGVDGLLLGVLRDGRAFRADELRVHLDRAGTGTLEETWWSVHFAPLREPDGRIARIACLCFEATEHVRRRQELEVARGAAESASRAKDEFFAMLGHELRNPIAPITTALHLMKLQPDAPFARERALVERHVGHLVRLVDDLLDVSRIARGRIVLARKVVDLNQVLARAVEAASPLLEERRHVLALEPAPEPVLVEGDEVRLVQVATNLLSNAAKYTPPRGRIRASARREGASVELTVADDGRGIDAELLPRIFDLFVQSHRPIDRVEGGLGLGLSIVRSLVELHGGTVTARSEGPGHGSEFRVRLPAHEPPLPEHHGALASTQPAARRGRRVLVVDDNQDAADLLAEALAAAGHEARRAFDGPAALRLAAEFAPDVALLDLGLPVMDGWELARRLREVPGCTAIRLFAVTGYGLDGDVARTRAAGFDGHLVKPVELERIYEVVES